MTPVTEAEKERALERVKASLNSLYHDQMINFLEFQILMKKAHEKFK